MTPIKPEDVDLNELYDFAGDIYEFEIEGEISDDRDIPLRYVKSMLANKLNRIEKELKLYQKDFTVDDAIEEIRKEFLK